jgi:hypothetical protein
MPFNFPIEQNRSGELLAQGITAAFANAAERRRQKRLEQQQDQARADQRTMVEVQNPGLHLTDRGVFDIPQSVWDTTARSVSDAVDRGGTASPAPARGISPLSDRSDFQSLLSQALGDKTPGGPRYEFGKGFYRDNAETDAAAQRTQARSGNADFQKMLMHVLENQLTPKPQQHIVDPTTGKVTFVDPTNPPKDLSITPAPKNPVVGSPEWQKSERFKASLVQPTNIFVPGVSPETGKPTIFSGKNRGSPTLTDTGIEKPQTLHIESAQNQAAKARMEAAISEMNNADAGMAEYEEKLRSGTANISGLGQLSGRVANAFTHDDPVSMTIQSTALASLNRTNPDLARYLRRALSFAEGESMISQRPSDFRTKMTAFLSGASSGASPEMIADIRSRRKAILTPLNANLAANIAAAAAKTGKADTPGNIDLGAKSKPASHAQQLWDAAVAKHGRDKVIQEYGPRPNE